MAATRTGGDDLTENWESDSAPTSKKRKHESQPTPQPSTATRCEKEQKGQAIYCDADTTDSSSTGQCCQSATTVLPVGGGASKWLFATVSAEQVWQTAHFHRTVSTPIHNRSPQHSSTTSQQHVRPANSLVDCPLCVLSTQLRDESVPAICHITRISRVEEYCRRLVVPLTHHSVRSLAVVHWRSSRPSTHRPTHRPTRHQPAAHPHRLLGRHPLHRLRQSTAHTPPATQLTAQSIRQTHQAE